MIVRYSVSGYYACEKEDLGSKRHSRSQIALLWDIPPTSPDIPARISIALHIKYIAAYHNMKLTLFTLLIPATMAFPGISTAQTWLASFQQPLKNLIENPLRRSTVPQFIIDARHPWILANQRKLERLSNNEAFLCSAPDSITSSAGTKRETFTEEEFKVPLDLFSKLEIDNNRWPISRPGWANALERLGEMKRCPRALDQVKMLDVDISIHDSKYSDLHLRILEPSQPPEQLLILFGDVLETMPNLEALKWRIPQKYIHFFESTFKSRNLTLSSIKHLEPGLSHYMVAMCPNLEELESERDGSGLLLIEAALSAPKLKRFAMEGDQFDGWTPELISGTHYQLHS